MILPAWSFIAFASAGSVFDDVVFNYKYYKVKNFAEETGLNDHAKREVCHAMAGLNKEDQENFMLCILGYSSSCGFSKDAGCALRNKLNKMTKSLPPNLVQAIDKAYPSCKARAKPKHNLRQSASQACNFKVKTPDEVEGSIARQFGLTESEAKKYAKLVSFVSPQRLSQLNSLLVGDEGQKNEIIELLKSNHLNVHPIISLIRAIRKWAEPSSLKTELGKLLDHLEEQYVQQLPEDRKKLNLKIFDHAKIVELAGKMEDGVALKKWLRWNGIDGVSNPCEDIAPLSRLLKTFSDTEYRIEWRLIYWKLSIAKGEVKKALYDLAYS